MIVWSTADFYGASVLVGARKKYMPLTPYVSWTHGCILASQPEWPIFLSKHELHFDRHLVTNLWQKESLSFLNKEVIAVGLPFAYAHRQFYNKDIVRTINRLYIPSHSISTQKMHESISDLFSIAIQHGCDHILINNHDYNMLYKAKDFTAGNNLNLNVKIIRGADITDPSCLKRMVTIFQAAKNIVTDAIGSHLYYATLCGCDVEIVDLRRITFDSYQSTLSKMTSPWKEAFFKYFQMVSEGEELLNQVSCFSSHSTSSERMYRSRQMLGVDCMISDDQLYKLHKQFRLKQKITISSYLFLRKLRVIQDY